MSKSLFPNYGIVTLNDNSTLYFSIKGQIVVDSQEQSAEFPVREAGVFSNFFVYVSANDTTTVSSTVKLRKNGANTAILVTIASGATGVFEDTTNTASCTNTDEVVYEFNVPNETVAAAVTIKTTSIEFATTATGNCLSIMGTAGAVGSSIASQISYSHLSGSCSIVDTNSALSKYRIRQAFTSRNLFVRVSANGRTTDTTFRTEKNGSNGTQSVTYGSTETGIKEDTTNTDSLIAGDDYQFEVVTGTGSGTITHTIMAVTFINTNGHFVMLSAYQVSQNLGAASTNYSGISGRLIPITSPEANTQVYPRFTLAVKELGVYVTTNSNGTGTFTVMVRDNGTDSPVQVVFAAGETGLKTDTSNVSDIAGGTDEINYKLVNTGDGAAWVTWIGTMGIAGYTVVATTGTFTLTGNPTASLAGRRLLITQLGSFQLIGNNAKLTRLYKLISGLGTFTLTGNTIIFNMGKSIFGGLGVFVLTGVASNQIKTYKLLVPTSVYFVTGRPTEFSSVIPGTIIFVEVGVDV